MTAPALDLHFAAHGDLGDLISAELHDLAPSAVHEIDSGNAAVWRVFFATGTARDAAREALRRRLRGHAVSMTPVDVPDEDWAARSQADLRHVRVDRIVVAPPWDIPADRLAAGDRLVVIRPSMGFGTGHHATTRLCLRLLQRIRCAGKRVLDVGTGSGVLALAAAALEASDVTGIDVDPDALASAGENLDLNASGPRELHAPSGRGRPRFVRADLRDWTATADIVLANLTGGALIASAPRLVACTAPGGDLLISGFQAHEAGEVLASFANLATCDAVEDEEDWSAALLRLRG